MALKLQKTEMQPSAWGLPGPLSKQYTLVLQSHHPQDKGNN